MIEVRCACGHKLVVFPQHAGSTMRCPKCREDVEVPVPEGYEPPPERTGPLVPPREDEGPFDAIWSFLARLFGR